MEKQAVVDDIFEMAENLSECVMQEIEKEESRDGKKWVLTLFFAKIATEKIYDLSKIHGNATGANPCKEESE